MAELVQMGVIVAGLLLAAIGMVWLWRTSARPSIIERLERSMVSNQTRLDTQEGEIDDLRRQIVELREGRIADHALLQEWINYARRLATMFTEATGKEPPPEPQTHRRDVAATTTAALLKLMCDAFDRDEVDGLVFEMGLGRNVRGDSTEDRARSLIDAAQRRGRLTELIELCRRDRPHGGF